MPLGKYKNFKECTKHRSEAYCGKIFWKTHGKKEGSKKLKKELEEMKKLVKKYRDYNDNR